MDKIPDIQGNRWIEYQIYRRTGEYNTRYTGGQMNIIPDIKEDRWI